MTRLEENKFTTRNHSLQQKYLVFVNRVISHEKPTVVQMLMDKAGDLRASDNTHIKALGQQTLRLLATLHQK